MKKFIIAAAILAVMLIGAILALPALVPAERIRDELVAAVRTHTGRELSIQGKVAVSVLPSLSVQVGNVALSSPPGFSSKDVIRIGALDVRLRLLPLLSGKVEVASFVLVDPVITLETDRHGHANWDFAAQGASAPAKPDDKARAAAAPAAPGDIRLGDVRISGGRLSFLDGRTGARQEFADIALTVALKSLDDPLAAKGGLKWNGKAVELSLDLASPRDALSGTPAAASLALAADTVRLAYSGRVAAGAAPRLEGDIDLAIPSLRGLAAWAGSPIALPGDGLGPVALKAGVAATPGRVALTGVQAAIDAIKARGEAAVELGGTRPAIKGRLEVEALDLTPYLPPEPPAGKPAAAKPQLAAAQGWSDEAIDASALKAADADLALSAGSIVVRKVHIGKSALRLTLKDGRLLADLSELALYQGSGRGTVALDGSAPGLGFDARFALNGVQAAPLLADAAGFDRLSGTAQADIAVSGRGRSQRAIVGALDGKGAVSFRDGAISGINLAAMMRNVTSAFTAANGAEKTDFAELSGSFTITRGLLRNPDLTLSSPLLRVEGKGTADLPQRRLDYRLESKLVASLEGQGGAKDLAGLTVPVVIDGPWDALSFRPDLAAMAKQAVPGALGQALQGMGGMGGGTPGAAPAALPVNPLKLFGR